MPFEGMGVSKELRAFLDAEVGSGTSDQIIYINEMIVEMYQMNPTGIRTFDPLNMDMEEDVELNFFDYSDSKRYYSEPAVVEYNKDSKPQYDLILGNETMKELGIVLDF